MALSRNLNDIATARMMAYANWVMESDPEQKMVLKGLLTEMQESEAKRPKMMPTYYWAVHPVFLCPQFILLLMSHLYPHHLSRRN